MRNKIRPQRIIKKNNKYYIFKNNKLSELTSKELDEIVKLGYLQKETQNKYITNKPTPTITRRKAIKTFSKREWKF